MTDLPYILQSGGCGLSLGDPALRAGNRPWRTLRRGVCAARRRGPISLEKWGKEHQGERVSFPLDPQSLGIEILWVGGPDGIDWPAALTL